MSTVGREAAFSLELVIAALQDVLGERGKDASMITPRTRLDALGLDSLDVAEFFVRLEELSGHAIDAASAEQLELVGDLTRLRPLEG